jgi:hypothetical protein
MPRWPKIYLLCLVAGASLVSPCAGQTEDPSLAAVLQTVPAARRLEIKFASGELLHGSLLQVHNDTLMLKRADQNGQPGPVTLHALAQVERVRQWRSNVNRGAGWGAASGGVFLGGFGLLVGLVATGYNSHADSDVAPIVAGTLAGAAIGALAGATLGGGVGALINTWQEIWPNGADLAANETSPPQPARPNSPTRLGLFAGLGRTAQLSPDFTRLGGRVSLAKTLSRRLNLGPEIAYYDFGEPLVSHQAGVTTVTSRQNLHRVAVALHLQRQSPGFAPYLTLGGGWYQQDSMFAGGHVGGGLRWRFPDGRDLELDLRHHFNLTDVDPDQVAKFWTLGIGFGFSI